MKAGVAGVRPPEGQDIEPVIDRCHLDVIVRDAANPPDLIAQGEAVTDAPFPDKLLIQLTDFFPTG